MKLSTILTMLIMLSAILQSCIEKRPGEGADDKVKFITQASFPKQRELQFVETNTQLGAVLDLAVIDTFLVKSDLRDSIIIHIYGLQSKKLIKKLLLRGVEKNECLSVSSILPTTKKDEFWCADITLRKLIKINISQALKNEEYIPEKEIVLKNSIKGIKSVSWICDTLFVATTYAEPVKRLIYFNDQSEIVNKSGELPIYDSANWPTENANSAFFIRAMAYSANVKHNPERNRSVVACTTTDRIDFFNGTQPLLSIQGPDRFNPHFVFRNEGKSYTPVPDKNTKFAYMGMSASKNAIYCLYSGENEMMTCGTKILEYDWYGKPKALYTIKENYCTIAIEEGDEKRKIWSVNPSNGKLIYANL